MDPSHQGQSDHGEVTKVTGQWVATATRSSPTSTSNPTPPRLTPNPTLLDSPVPTLTATSSSPPPPLTPAPSLSKAAGPPPCPPPGPPPGPLPSPPKLSSALRTYSRPILPSATVRSQTIASPTMHCGGGSSGSPTPSPTRPNASTPLPLVSSVAPPLASSSSSSSSSSSATNSSCKASPAGLANGNARPVSTATSTPITPFHTPASPPGRQVTTQAHLLGTPGLVQANQSSPPVRQRISPQTLLLGKGLKGSGQEQVLLRAQMLILTSAMRPSSSSSSSACSSSHPASAQLQSLTLRPPPPGTLTIPPSLRLKSPPLAPPPLSRPRAPIFPPLRPRPQPSATATERPAMPTRHLSVPPPTLYSPVRAVPLRPRLHTPNGHKMASPRPSSSLQPIVAVPAGQVPPSNRHLVGLQSGPLSQTPPPASQSQQSLISASSAVTPTSQIERSPSAARQLQIMALSSGRHPLHGNGGRASVQSPPPVVETPEFTSQSQRASGNTPPLSLKPSLVKTTTPLPSPPSVKPSSVKTSTPLLSPPSVKPSSVKTSTPLLSPPSVKPSSVKTSTPLLSPPSVKPSSVKPTPPLPFPPSLLRPTSPPGQTTPHSDASVQRGGEKQSRVTEHEEKQEKRGVASGLSKADDDAGGGKERSTGIEPDQREREKIKDEEACGGTPSLEERMDVTEEGQREKAEGDKEEGLVDQAEAPTHRCQSLEAKPKPDLVSSPEPGAMVCLDLSMAPGAVPVQIPPPSPVAVPEPIPVPVSEAVSQPLRAEVPTRDPQAVGQEDYCEILSTQSDSQSALSSLSSQSSPTSPFILPSADNPPPLLPAQPATQDLTGLSQRQPEMLGKPQEDTEHLSKSGDDAEHFDQPEWGPWVPRAWPEGREVLTHLVEGFVIKEGLQPFPVNRSSLLVQEEIKIPQEVNGTNGKEVFPVTETIQRTEHSTDTDDEEVAPTEDPSTRSSHRDRTVLHCQFCGKRGHAHNFMRSKRFCSTSCARGFNVRLTKRLRALSAGSRSERPRPVLNRAQSVPGKPLLLRLPRDLWSAGRRDKDGKRGERNEDDEAEDDEEEDGTGDEGPPVATATKIECRAAKRARRASEPAVSTSSPTTTFKPRPAHWSVEDVTSFIHTLPGCSEVAESFRLQEIDGQALLLLTEDHLMTSMNIKLGPALKICAHINSLKHQ